MKKFVGLFLALISIFTLASCDLFGGGKDKPTENKPEVIEPTKKPEVKPTDPIVVPTKPSTNPTVEPTEDQTESSESVKPSTNPTVEPTDDPLKPSESTNPTVEPTEPEKIYYTATVYGYDGSVLKEIRVLSGSRISEDDMPTPPEIENMNFIEWDFNFYSSIYSNVSIRPVYEEIKSYQISFDASLNMDPVEVRKGEKYTLSVPQKEGYRFITYMLNGSDFPLSGKYYYDYDIVLSVKWEEICNTISYHLDGGSNAANNPTKLLAGESKNLLAPAKYGYRFMGWYSDSRFTNKVESISFDSNKKQIDLYARFLKEYTITYYNVDGYDLSAFPKTYVKGEEIILPPLKTESSFLGWCIDSSLSIPFTNNPNRKGNLSLYAKFDTKHYIHAEGMDYEVYEDCYYYIQSPNKEGYNFKCYMYEGKEFPLSGTYTYKKDVTLTAVWLKMNQKITYVMGIDDFFNPNPAQYNEGDYVQLRDASSNTFRFAGWYLDSEFTKQITMIDYTFRGELTIYGKWETIPDNIEFKFPSYLEVKVDGALPDCYNVGEKLALPNLNAAGYKFLGWRIEGTEELFNELYYEARKGWVTLEGVFEACEYNINIKYSNTDIRTIKAKYKENIQLDVPSRDGFTFMGLALDDGTEIQFNFVYNYTRDITIECQWEAIKYSIYYNFSNGIKNPHTVFEYTVLDDNIKLLEISNDQYLINSYHISQGEHNYVGMEINTSLTGNVTVTPNVSEHFYNVYIYDDIHGFSLDCYTYNYNLKLPERNASGYVFDGYYFNDGTKLPDSYAIKGDIELTARYKKEVYTITYNLNGGTLPLDYPKEFTIDDEIILPIPTKAGYELIYWSSRFGELNKISKGTTGNIEVTANWATRDYKINVLANVAGFDFYKTISYYESYVLVPLEIENYTFVRFEYNGVEFNKEGKYSYTNDITINAIYKIKDRYSVEYDLALGTALSKYDELTNYGGTIYLYEPYRLGYVFDKWVDEEGESYIIGKNVLTKNVKLTATWTLDKYELIFLGYSNLNRKYTIEDEFTLEPIEKEGYIFTGWISNGRVIEKISKGSTDNLVLKPSFRKISFVVTINLDGGSMPGISLSQKLYYGDYLDIEKPTKEGYIFLNFVRDDGIYFDINGAIKSDKDFTIIAKWEKIKEEVKSAHISYNLGIYADFIKDFNPIYNYTKDSIDFTIPEISLNHTIFIGWYLDDEYKNKFTGLDLSNIVDLKLYPKFEKLEYDITVKLNNGYPDLIITAKAFENVNLAEFTKEGYYFLNMTDDSGHKFDELSFRTNADVLNVNWAKSVKITIYKDRNTVFKEMYVKPHSYLVLPVIENDDPSLVFGNYGLIDGNIGRDYGRLGFYIYDTDVELIALYYDPVTELYYEDLGNNELMVSGDIIYNFTLNNVVIPDMVGEKRVTSIASKTFDHVDTIVFGANIKNVEINAITGYVHRIVINDAFTTEGAYLLNSCNVDIVELPITHSIYSLYNFNKKGFDKSRTEFRFRLPEGSQESSISLDKFSFNEALYNISISFMDGISEITNTNLKNVAFRYTPNITKINFTDPVKIIVDDYKSYFACSKVYAKDDLANIDYKEDVIIIDSLTDPNLLRNIVAEKIKFADNLTILGGFETKISANSVEFSTAVTEIQDRFFKASNVDINFIGTEAEFKKIKLGTESLNQYASVEFTKTIEFVMTNEYCYNLIDGKYIYDLNWLDKQSSIINLSDLFPNKVIKTLKDECFRNMHISVITIPSTIESFYMKFESPVETVYYDEGSSSWSSKSGSSVGAKFVNFNSNVKRVELIDTANYVYYLLNGKQVSLKECKNISAATINLANDFNGYEVVVISDAAFKNMTNLKDLVIPEGVKYLGDAFNYRLETLRFTNIYDINVSENALRNVKYIYTKDMNSLTHIMYEGEINVDTIFVGEAPLTTLNLGDEITNLPTGILRGYTKPLRLNVNANFTYGNAFNEFNNLSIYVNDLSIWLGIKHNIYNPIGFSKLYLNDVLLTDLTIDNVSAISSYTFYGYDYLNSVTIKGVTSIGDYAFTESSITRFISCPELTTIGNSAFKNSMLKEFYLENQAAEDTIIVDGLKLDYLVFYNTKAKHVKVGSIEGYSSIFAESKNLLDIEFMPSFIGVVPGSMFENSTSVNSIKGLERANEIYDSAFDGIKIKNVNVSKDLTVIGSGAFDFKNVENITVDPLNPIYTSQDEFGNECNVLIHKASNELLLLGKVANIPGSITGINKYIMSQDKNGIYLYPKSYDEFLKLDNTFDSQIKNRILYNQSYLKPEKVTKGNITFVDFGGFIAANVECTDLNAKVVDLASCLSGYTEVHLNIDNFNSLTGVEEFTYCDNIKDEFVLNADSLKKLGASNSIINLNKKLENVDVYFNNPIHVLKNAFIDAISYNLYLNNELINYYKIPDGTRNFDLRALENAKNIEFIYIPNKCFVGEYGEMHHITKTTFTTDNYSGQLADFDRLYYNINPSKAEYVNNDYSSFILADNEIYDYKLKNYDNAATINYYDAINSDPLAKDRVVKEITLDKLNTSLKAVFLRGDAYKLINPNNVRVFMETPYGRDSISADYKLDYKEGLEFAYVDNESYTYIVIEDRIYDLYVKGNGNIIDLETDFLNKKIMNVNFNKDMKSKILITSKQYDNLPESIKDIVYISPYYYDGVNNTGAYLFSSDFVMVVENGITYLKIFDRALILEIDKNQTALNLTLCDSTDIVSSALDGVNINELTINSNSKASYFVLEGLPITKLTVIDGIEENMRIDFSMVTDLTLNNCSSWDDRLINVKNLKLINCELIRSLNNVFDLVVCENNGTRYMLNAALMTKKLVYDGNLIIQSEGAQIEEIHSSGINAMYPIRGLKMIYLSNLKQDSVLVINTDAIVVYDKSLSDFESIIKDYGNINLLTNSTSEGIEHVVNENYDYYKSGNNVIILKAFDTRDIINVKEDFTGLNVSLAKHAFSNLTKLKEVTLPAVTHLPEGVFEGCSLLSKVNLEDGVIEIGSCAFKDTALEAFTIPGSVKIIKDNAFNGANLKSLTIPFGVESILDNAFSNNAIETLVIEASLSSVGITPFYNNNIKKVYWNSPNFTDGSILSGIEALEYFEYLYDNNIYLPVGRIDYYKGNYRSGKSIELKTVELTSLECLSFECETLILNTGYTSYFGYSVGKITCDNLIIQDSIDALDLHFIDIYQLKSLKLPASIKTLPSYELINLRFDFEIPEGIEVVEQYSLPQADVLNLPSSVRIFEGAIPNNALVLNSIPENIKDLDLSNILVAFKGSSEDFARLKSILGPNVILVNDYVSHKVINTERYHLDLYNDMYALNVIWKDSSVVELDLASEIPYEILTLSDYALSSCRALQKLYLPKTLVNLKRGNLGRLHLLKELHVEDLNAYLHSVSSEIPNLEIKDYDLYEGDRLVEVLDITEDLESLSIFAVENCTSIKKLIMSSNSNIGNQLIGRLPNLEVLEYKNGSKEINAYLSGSKIKNIILPEGLTKVSLSLPKSITYIEIPSGVLEVFIQKEEKAIAYVPSSVTKIESNNVHIIYGGTEEEYKNVTSNVIAECASKPTSVEYKKKGEISYFLIDGNKARGIETTAQTLDLKSEFVGLNVDYIMNPFKIYFGDTYASSLVLSDECRYISYLSRDLRLDTLHVNKNLIGVGVIEASINNFIVDSANEVFKNSTTNALVMDNTLISLSRINSIIPNNIEIVAEGALENVNDVFIPKSVKQILGGYLWISNISYEGTEEEWNKLGFDISYMSILFNQVR